MKIFVPLVKVDEETRTVYGRLTQEVVDRSGEIMDYESSKEHFQNWSQGFMEKTDGRSKGNLRAMHGKVAAGKFVDVIFNDAEKAIDVAAKVVDPTEWEKCLEGVYTGFSVGGRYVKRWLDEQLGKMRYTAGPVEGSLVDAPCVPTANFALVKADGTVEEHAFAASEDLLKQAWTCGIAEHKHFAKDEARACIESQVMEKVDQAVEGEAPEDYVYEGDDPDADDAAEKADGKTKGKTVGGKVYPAKCWAYVPDPGKPSTWKLRLSAEPDGVPTSRLVAGCVAALGKGFRGKKVEIPAKDLPKVKARVRAAWRKVHKGDGMKMPDVLKWEDGDLQKGMYGVANFARIIEDLDCLARCQEFEEEQEGDGSTMSSKLKTLVSTAGDLLLQMVKEETEELTEGDDVEVLSLSEQGELTKLAFNSERYPVLAKLTATPTGDGTGNGSAAEDELMTHEEMQKMLAERDEKLTKAQTDLAASNEKLEKAEEKITAQDEKLTKQGEQIDALTKRLDEVAERAAPAKGAPRLVALSKSEDGGDASDEDNLKTVAEALEKMDPEERSLFLTKVAQRHPSVVTSKPKTTTS